MTLTLNPPPLQIPKAFAAEKESASFFSGLINTLYQVWTELYSIRTKVTTKTTDATTTSALRIGIPTDRTMLIEARIVARRTGGGSGATGDSAWYVMKAGFKNIAGTLTQIGSTDLVSGENQAGWNVGVQTSGNNAVIVVLGAAGNNITWESTVSTYTVGA